MWFQQDDTIRCNYFTVTDTANFYKPIIVRDSIVYNATSKPKTYPGAAIWSVAGKTLTIKLNGKTGTPNIVNKGSTIRWR